MSLRCAFGVVLLAATLTAGAVPTTTVSDVTTARGTIRIAHYRPDVPLANLYVMSGGDGVLRLQANGAGTTEQYTFNPLVRIRPQLLAAGYSVIYIDAPSDMLNAPGIPFAHRATPAHAAELLAVIQFVQQQDNLPAWMLGFSAGGPSVVNAALAAPRSTPFGLVLLSPNTTVEPHVLSMNLEQVQRPTLLLTHANDTCAGTPPANAPTVMSRLSGTEARLHRIFTAGITGTRGGGCDSTGHHGLGGEDALFVAELIDWMRHQRHLTQAANYQGLWWRSPANSESGWGVNITHHGNILFATWFTYDLDGSGMWLVMPSSTRTSEGVYTGTLYRTTGPAFNVSPWAGTVDATAVGSATFTFEYSNNGTFAYVVNGISQSKPITKQLFQEAPACIAGASHLASPNYQSLWWAAPANSESGWGVNVAHQGDILFATWFTYAAGGRGQWLVMPSGALTSPGVYSGILYRTTGPAFNLTPWAGTINATPVGNATFTFTSAENGTFAYTLDGVSQSKPIVREVFAAPVTVCR
jgi:hypothetical protein